MKLTVIFSIVIIILTTTPGHSYHGFSMESLLESSSHVHEYTNYTLVEAVNRRNMCTVVCAGAAWDGHFAAWVKRHAWRDLSLTLVNNNVVNIEIGYILSNKYSLPPIGEWAPSPPSYVIRFFHSGQLLRNISLELELRSSYPVLRPTAWVDLVKACNIDHHEIANRRNNKDL